MCVGCTVDGLPGDGMKQGNCPDNTKCHSDGTCSVCSDVDGNGDEADPHSGCSKLNPNCDTINDQCMCGSVMCTEHTATTCTSSVCMCNQDPACTMTTPVCDQAIDPAQCVMCHNSDGGPGDNTEQGTCDVGEKCQADGSCA